MTTLHPNEAYRALEEEYQRLWRLARGLREQGLGMSETDAVGELSSLDQHTADLGAETYEREKDLGLLMGAYMQMEQVLQARDRLDQGRYGVCEDCRRPIDPERQRALPATTLCVECKDRREKRDVDSPRPLEETILSLPMPENALTPGIDGQDIWDMLAPYGTANSPQDAPEADLPDNLWRDLVRDFPGNPEMELATELTPEDSRAIARDYYRAAREEARQRRQK